MTSKDILIKQGDCLELMKEIPDKSIDMILCDLPYGTTACKWDEVIPFEALWEQYNRIIKNNGAIVLFGSQPFTSKLVMSNIKNFKYEWIYQKVVGSNFATAKYMPMKEHKNVLVFGKGKVRYHPIMQKRAENGLKRIKSPFITNSEKGGEATGHIERNNAGKEYSDLRNPSSVQKFNNRGKDARGLHPTQKPVDLLEYLIKTYTNENETVLDNCMGSGSTGIACIRTNRKFIGFELDEKYFNIAKERIERETNETNE